MNNKEFQKEYLAITEGIFDNKNGTINLPIARKENSIIERCINENGQTSITHYTVLKEFENYSLVKCTLETGRTHQIRVHMKYIGYPVFNDPVYGNQKIKEYGQFLHSTNIDFIHPITKEHMHFTCPLPSYITNFLNTLEEI